MKIAPQSKPVTLKAISAYLNARLKELEDLASPGHPWSFLASCTYLDFCSALAIGGKAGKEDFKNFVKDYLFPVRPEYNVASYPMTGLKLDDQMYHVLRCGVTHSFSMRAEQDAKSAVKFPTKPLSIMLAHRKSNIPHLQYIELRGGTEAYALIAEDFVADLRKATDAFLSAARKRSTAGASLRKGIISRFKSRPPLGWTIFRIV